MSMGTLDRSRREPLWAQLHADLLRRLAAGDFAAGFPGEAQLRDEYEVSRHTVREAMRRIREAGLVESGRGRQSQVLSQRIEQPLGSLYSLFREIESRGIVQESVVLSCGLKSHPEAAAQLGLPPESDLFALERIRLAGGEPLAHDCVWLPAQIGKPLLDTDFTRTALYDELAKHHIAVPDSGRERITATLISPKMASRLNTPVPAAGLTIERTGLRKGKPMECRRTTVRADRYELLMAWNERGYEVGGQTS